MFYSLHVSFYTPQSLLPALTRAPFQFALINPPYFPPQVSLIEQMGVAEPVKAPLGLVCMWVTARQELYVIFNIHILLDQPLQH